MSLRDLSTPTMVTIVAAWVDPARERKLLEGLQRAAFLLPTLVEAHQLLVSTQAIAPDGESAELPAVQQEQADVDTEHDRKVRGIYGALTAFAELVDDPDKAARYLSLRDKLFPEGLAVINWSYVDEAGEADLVEGRLTYADRVLLKYLPYPGGKLWDAHERRLASARRLGELERKKQDLIRARETREGRLGPVDVIKARNAWIRAVRAFLGVLELEKSIAPEVKRRILGPLEDAERKAAARGGNEDAEAPISTIPISTIPSSAVPSSAVPSSAVPSSAAPSSTVPSSTTKLEMTESKRAGGTKQASDTPESKSSTS